MLIVAYLRASRVCCGGGYNAEACGNVILVYSTASLGLVSADCSTGRRCSIAGETASAMDCLFRPRS